jgi:hypothetical protein
MFGTCHRPDFFASGREGSRRGRSGWSRRFAQGWGDEQRTPRGDIKYILLALIAEQPRHGYQLIKNWRRVRLAFIDLALVRSTLRFSC